MIYCDKFGFIDKLLYINNPSAAAACSNEYLWLSYQLKIEAQKKEGKHTKLMMSQMVFKKYGLKQCVATDFLHYLFMYLFSYLWRVLHQALK